MSLSEKRRDQKGRILKTGESQRNDGHYMFRYTDIHKKRRYVYAKTLEELRQKEADIQRDTVDGIDYAAGEMTVIELVTRYMNLKRSLKENSFRAYPAISLLPGGNTRTMPPLSADGRLTIPLKLPRKRAYPITATRREKVYETSF